MSTGILTAAWMCAVLSQAPNDAHYTNQRNHEIPVNVEESVRADTREFRLYMSSDQGAQWNLSSRILPDKKGFVFYAPGDGTYWFQVAFVNRAGVQNPDEKSIPTGRPHLVMVIDTLKPIVNSFQAQRAGDEILVTWDVKEDHPDLSKDGMRLEYQVKDALVEKWTPIAMQSALKGQMSFTPADKRTLVLRLTVRDRAKNESYGSAEVPGTIAAAGFAAAGSQPPALPAELKIPPRPIEQGKQPVIVPPPIDVKALSPDRSLVMPPLARDVPAPEKVVADSRIPAQPEPVKQPDVHVPPPAPPGERLLDVKPPVAPTPTRKLPALQHLSQHAIKLQYELKRVGPSGIGGVEIWLTKDDGATWKAYAEVNDIQHEMPHGVQVRDFEFRDDRNMPFPDGVYGLSLVVKNRAGVGRTPHPGDVPEIRVEIDTNKPVVKMFPPIPDPAHPTQLLIKWSVQDKNLIDAPVNLEYAETPKGPWLPIELNLRNTGRHVNPQVTDEYLKNPDHPSNPLVTGDYSWKVPSGTPIQVYLRVRAVDHAGNEGIASMTTPQFVDLVVPEGALIGIQTK